MNDYTDLLDIDRIVADYREKLEMLRDLHLATPQLSQRDRDFADSLYGQFQAQESLSPNQWLWVGRLLERVVGAEPIYGDYSAIMVMFRISGAHLKRPRIRLVTNWRHPNKYHRFIQLTFRQDREPAEVEIHLDGWAGSGSRKFAGWLMGGKMTPYQPGLLDESIRNAIQDFCMDPKRCAHAMAALIGSCVYCGNRLTDDDSKRLGYGPICAHHFGLPHGPHA